MCQSSKVRNKHDSPKAWAWALRANTHSHGAVYRRQNGRLKPVAGSAQKWASPATLQSRMKSLRCQMAACAKPTNNSDNDNSDRSSDRIRQNNSSKMRGNQYRFTALKVQGAKDDPAPSIQTLRVKMWPVRRISAVAEKQSATRRTSAGVMHLRAEILQR